MKANKFLWLMALGMVAGGATIAAGIIGARAALHGGAPTNAARLMSERQRLAGSCAGWNLEAEVAAAAQTRLGNGAEAARLLALRRSCDDRQASR